MRRLGAKAPPLDGLDKRWFVTKRSLVESTASCSSPDSSSIPRMMLGLVGRLGGGPST